jgi:hypothetical protein
MARAEYAGLAGFFKGLGTGAEKIYEQKLEQEKRKIEEESEYRKAVSDLFRKQAEEGLLEREVEVPAAPRPELPLTLAQRLETGVPPRLGAPPPPTIERRPLTAEEQVDIMRSIYKGQKLPKGIKIKEKEAKEAFQIPIFYSDPITKTLYTSTGEEYVGDIPKGSKIIRQAVSKEVMSPEEKLEYEAKRKELSTSLQILPRLDQALLAVQNLKKQFEKGYKPREVAPGDIIAGATERYRGFKARMEALAGARAELSTYLANREAFSSLISKGGFFEAGVLTNPDIERVLKALPTAGNTEQEVESKWRELKAILGAARTRFEQKYQAFTGKPYTGKETEVKVETKAPVREPETEYNIGDIITAPDGKRYRIRGFYEDGEPDVEPI